VLVKTRVDGQIVKIDFVEGQAVHAGDVLAEIDARPYEAQRDLAVATKLKTRRVDNARLDFERASRLGDDRFRHHPGPGTGEGHGRAFRRQASG